MSDRPTIGVDEHYEVWTPTAMLLGSDKLETAERIAQREADNVNVPPHGAATVGIVRVRIERTVVKSLTVSRRVDEACERAERPAQEG